MIREGSSERPPRSGAERGHRFGIAFVFAFLLALPGAAAPPAGADATARLAESVAEAQRLVETVRGVPFRGPVPSALLPENQLPKILEKKLVEDLPVPFPRYTASLAALGLIDPSTDLLKKLVRLYARQVAGFYDPSERKFYIVPERSGEAAADLPELGISASGMMEEALLTHELTHALQDRRLDLDRRIKGLKESTDALLALEAFLEGEATVVMTEALISRVPGDARSLLGGEDLLGQMMTSLAAGGTADVEGSEGVPEFFVKELLFPYTAGTAWIQKRRAGGGWGPIDEAYTRLPQSTSEILHPERSFGGRQALSAAEIPGPRDLPAGARRMYSDTLGEWVLRTLLERAGAGEDAERLAAGREDDRILFFEVEGGHVGFVWRIRCASEKIAAQLAEAIGPLYTGRPAPARPGIRAKGFVVEVARGGLEAGPPRKATSPQAAAARAAGR